MSRRYKKNILVTANGGLIGYCGTQVMTAAAKYHSTPVCVLAPMYKLTPIFPENGDTLNLLVNPDPIFSFESQLSCQTEVLNPLYDYVGPQLVDLLITNT